MIGDAINFLREVFTNGSLSERVLDAVDSSDLMLLGREYGATFTAEELKNILQAQHDYAAKRAQAESAALSLDDLEHVAGGAGVSPELLQLQAAMNQQDNASDMIDQLLQKFGGAGGIS